MAAYRRAYLAWHAAQYRDSRFQSYSVFRESVEYLTIERLSRLAVEVDVGRREIDTMLDDQLAQRCSVHGLAEALNDRPTCPRCGLRLDDEVRLLSGEQVREATLGAIEAYITQVRSPETAAAIEAYARTLGPDSSVRSGLEQVLASRSRARPREVLACFTEDIVAHLNRAMGGQVVHSRRLNVLAPKLADRTLTRDEVERLVNAWLTGDDDPRGDDLIVVDV
jgi:hypothetical protein